MEEQTKEEKQMRVPASQEEDERTPDSWGPAVEAFYRSKLDQTKEYPDPVPILSLRQNNVMITLLTLMSFSLWQGKQKSKKTTVLAMMVAALIQGVIEGANGLFVACRTGVVIFFDNEQGESYAARTMRLILSIAGVQTSENLIYCDLRAYKPEERMKIIHASLLVTKNVIMIVIDGLVDLMDDFMAAREGHMVTTALLSLCSQYNIHIAGVLHQNKQDKNPRAHIGSIASQKCEVEMATEVDPGDPAQSIVTCVNSRGLPFRPFAIRWDRGSLPYVNEDWRFSIVARTKGSEGGLALAKSVFQQDVIYSYTEAINAMVDGKVGSESTAKRLLRTWLDEGFVVKGEQGGYTLKAEQTRVAASPEMNPKHAHLSGSGSSPLKGDDRDPSIITE